MGYDRTAPKQAISINLNEDLLRQAGLVTVDLDRTLENLLEAFVDQESQRRAKQAAIDEFIRVSNARHAEHGLLSDEFQVF